MTFKICIDPGHQETPDFDLEPIYPGASTKKAKCAPGTSGIFSGVQEHQVVLTISLLLKSSLEKNGHSVVMTRDRNDVRISNKERAEFANRNNAALCLKIHCNGVRNSLRYVAFLKRGAMTLTPAKDRVQPECMNVAKGSRR